MNVSKLHAFVQTHSNLEIRVNYLHRDYLCSMSLALYIGRVQLGPNVRQLCPLPIGTSSVAVALWQQYEYC